jgi:hypothetical protein
MDSTTFLDATQPEWWFNAAPAFPDEPGPSEEDLRWAAESFATKFGEPAPAPIRDARGLLLSIADHLTSLGLEPECRTADGITVQFLGRLFSIELEDIDSRLERVRAGISQDELAMLAGGLAVG